MSEIEYVPGGTKVIKSVCITTDNPRLSPPCPPATHPQMWNPLEFAKYSKWHNRPIGSAPIHKCGIHQNMKNISSGTTDLRPR